MLPEAANAHPKNQGAFGCIVCRQLPAKLSMFGRSTLSYLLFKRTVLLSSLAKLVYSLCDGVLSIQNLLYVVVQSTHVAPL